MVSEEFLRNQEEGVNHDGNSMLQDLYDDEEQEETLSLCDLPTYSSCDSAHWDDYFSIEGHNSSQSNDDDYNDEFFEFCSEEFTTPSHETIAKNIIFCGKLIPFKEATPKHHRNEEKNSCVNLAWSTPNSCDKAKHIIPCDAKGSKKNNLCDYGSTKKVSLIRSRTKSRWHMFMFGFGVSTEMDLSDIRSRQSRLAPAKMIPVSSEQGRDEMVKNKGKGKKNMKGLWRIVKAAFL